MSRERRDRYFFAGGQYCAIDGLEVMVGQAYIHEISPLDAAAPFPLVMIHGGGLTGLTWEATPDGRPGWVDYFVDLGFRVFVMDQPARGRSAWNSDVHGALRQVDTRRIEQRFTAPERFSLWDQARLHTQWPGSGLAGDEIFDQFRASQVPYLASRATSERITRAAGAALLDSIGPAILLTHSQSGPFGWQIADARPGLVKGIVALEPNGPPFVRLEEVGPPEYRVEMGEDRPWGVTATPLTYDPALLEGAELSYVREESAAAPAFVPCYAQRSPARRLPNLAHIPVAVVTSEAGYHAAYDHCTVKFLRSAGVSAEHLRLEDEGVHGNGHMMMIERNSDEVAAVVYRWLKNHGLAASIAVGQPVQHQP